LQTTPDRKEIAMHPPRVYWLRADIVQTVLDRNHLSHLRFADHLGISRSYWSQLVNRRRSLSPDLRRDLVASRYFRGIPEDQLWDIVEPEKS
jgi:hypothetical protein